MPQNTTASSAPAPTPGSEHSLVRAVGVWGLAAAIANVTIGGGILRAGHGGRQAENAATDRDVGAGGR